ncbi:hypothetical protein OHA72_16350 [Dactylosporangium sp. NBC_01737]|uniref:hypothetical protein n=1 Tax=Dactylosporangium sp. NBC_01737 TaxID=2975959 RepID=UPI002E14DE03|nr:hypothetical protein OHA72_16350 [Dactylosporangium sp. NBC_01737]
MARFSTLFLALLIASPALYATFVTHQLDLETGLLRLLIAVPVAAVMLAVFRLVTRDYGKPDVKQKEPAPEPGADEEPLRAEAVAGDPFPQRRAEDAP